MKIGVLLPADFALTKLGNGVRVAAVRQADALIRAGHEVARLDSWNWDANQVRQLDLVHFYLGASSMLGIEHYSPEPARRLVMQPMIDSNEPFWRYRLAAEVTRRIPRIRTVPAVLQHQAYGSKLIIARSSHEQQRIVRGLGISPAKVRIILHGTEPPGQVDPDGVRRRFGLPEKFLFHVSTYGQARKNAVGLIEAAGPTGLPLVIAGTPEESPTLKRVREVASKFNVRLLGYQDQQTLNSLYAAARVFCLPSIHEGVGLAALEAATYGAGIVITRNGGPPDYFLGLAQYVDPYDVADIRRGILKAWDEPRSDDLKNRMSELSWDRTTLALVDAFQTIIGTSSPT